MMVGKQLSYWEGNFLDFLVTMLKLREGNPTYFFNNGQLVLSDLDWRLLTLFFGETFQFQAKKAVSAEDWAPKNPPNLSYSNWKNPFNNRLSFARYNIKILYIGIYVND